MRRGKSGAARMREWGMGSDKADKLHFPLCSHLNEQTHRFEESQGLISRSYTLVPSMCNSH